MGNIKFVFLSRENGYITMRIQVEQEEKRCIVVKSAMSLFCTKGIKDVTMDDIAHELKMSMRTLYELFDDKESLMQSVHAHRLVICKKERGFGEEEYAAAKVRCTEEEGRP
jgi:AraC-like DNA-binding protein